MRIRRPGRSSAPAASVRTGVRCSPRAFSARRPPPYGAKGPVMHSNPQKPPRRPNVPPRRPHRPQQPECRHTAMPGRPNDFRIGRSAACADSHATPRSAEIPASGPATAHPNERRTGRARLIDPVPAGVRSGRDDSHSPSGPGTAPGPHQPIPKPPQPTSPRTSPYATYDPHNPPRPAGTHLKTASCPQDPARAHTQRTNPHPARNEGTGRKPVPSPVRAPCGATARNASRRAAARRRHSVR